MELWNLSASEATFLPDISLLDDAAARYPSCDTRHVGSAALKDTTLNTATVAYYSGTTPGSTGKKMFNAIMCPYVFSLQHT